MLVVDDDEVSRKNLCRLLVKEGHETAEAKDAPRAPALLERSNFHLLITDLVMEGMSGLDLLSAVKRHDPVGVDPLDA